MLKFQEGGKHNEEGDQNGGQSGQRGRRLGQQGGVPLQGLRLWFCLLSKSHRNPLRCVCACVYEILAVGTSGLEAVVVEESRVDETGNSLVVQWLDDSLLSLLRAQVQCLVGELRSHKPSCMPPTTKKEWMRWVLLYIERGPQRQYCPSYKKAHPWTPWSVGRTFLIAGQGWWRGI